MKNKTVTIVRIYITESSNLLNRTINYLQETKINGFSVFRAISGHGETGTRTSALVDLSLNLPLVIEFFDIPKKVDAVLKHLNTIIKPEHVIFWEGKANSPK